MQNHRATIAQAANEAEHLPKAALEHGSLTLAAIGLALCISAPEASRYSALWHISDESSLCGVASKVAYLLLCFLVVRRAGTHGSVPLYRNRLLLVTLIALQTIGFALLIASSCGWDAPEWVAPVRSALLDSSFFIFAAFASFYLRTDTKTAITAFVAAVIIAGTVQICIAFIPFHLAASCVVLLAPLSVCLLFLADRRVRAAEAWYATLPNYERAVFDDETAKQTFHTTSTMPREDTLSPSRIGLYATIALLSLIVAAIHLSWLGIQDGETASIMVQVCAGIGTVLAGNILLAMKRAIEDREVIEFTRLIVLPIAIGTLYVASLLSGSLVALAVIPLNIVYVAVLLLAWLAPFVYTDGQHAIVVSCDAFLAKRLGVVVGLGIMRDIAIGEFTWLSELFVVVALAGLIALSVGQFLYAKRRAERALTLPLTQAILDAEETRDLACTSIADHYRLTPRERDVLELLVRGRTAGYIAETLVISSTTAKTHIKHIYQKAGVQSKQALLDIVEVEQQRLTDRCAGTSDTL